MGRSTPKLDRETHSPNLADQGNATSRRPAPGSPPPASTTNQIPLPEPKVPTLGQVAFPGARGEAPKPTPTATDAHPHRN
ncbi:MAG: hypothetical protein SYR96_37175, partial [Actinomycetota bacterium]|nr:hypothetical protein [Actinomycetota bacterium]